MAMLAFGVKNLRCLTETGLIPIKPISLLVGRNSSGKSTYLRAFPLLKQSVLTTRSSPILWFHDDYVDFGSIGHAIRKQANPRTVTFEFRVAIPATPTSVATVGEVALELRDVDGNTDVGAVVVTSSQGTFRLEADLDHGSIGIGTDGGVVHRSPQAVYRFAGPTSLIPRLGVEQEPPVSFPRYIPSDDYDEVFIGHAMRSLIKSRDWASINLNDEETKGVALVSIVLAALDATLAAYVSGVAYLAPQRAKGERQSRIQDLGVDEIDPQGNNLAMFLKSLTAAEMASFGEFTQKHLGFVPSVRVDRLQAEILIREPRSDEAINLVDVGFGYSQVLPLVAILWSTCIREPAAKLRRPTLLALEQPELHLHPAFQAKLASMFADAMGTSRDKGHMVPLMIETHSEAIVNGMGHLIAQGKLAKDDVQIVLFDQNDETRDTSVRIAGYDDQGDLRDWPFGFFAPVMDD